MVSMLAEALKLSIRTAYAAARKDNLEASFGTGAFTFTHGQARGPLPCG
jgi:hypothetical protein